MATPRYLRTTTGTHEEMPHAARSFSETSRLLRARGIEKIVIRNVYSVRKTHRYVQ